MSIFWFSAKIFDIDFTSVAKVFVASEMELIFFKTSELEFFFPTFDDPLRLECFVTFH
jgi:hypothetical protein